MGKIKSSHFWLVGRYHTIEITVLHKERGTIAYASSDSEKISSHYKEKSHIWFVAVAYYICLNKHSLFESIVSVYVPSLD